MKIGRLSEHVALRHFSPSEMHTRENLFQSRRNLRIKHLVVGEISSPCQPRNRLRCHQNVD